MDRRTSEELSGQAPNQPTERQCTTSKASPPLSPTSNSYTRLYFPSTFRIRPWCQFRWSLARHHFSRHRRCICIIRKTLPPYRSSQAAQFACRQPQPRNGVEPARIEVAARASLKGQTWERHQAHYVRILLAKHRNGTIRILRSSQRMAFWPLNYRCKIGNEPIQYAGIKRITMRRLKRRRCSHEPRLHRRRSFLYMAQVDHIPLLMGKGREQFFLEAQQHRRELTIIFQDQDIAQCTVACLFHYIVMTQKTSANTDARPIVSCSRPDGREELDLRMGRINANAV
jgi:hypothetical protein